MTRVPGWVGRYIGLPFVDGGRSWAGVDCFGLVRLVLSQEAAVEIPVYGETSATELAQVARLMARDRACAPWREVEATQARRFDVVLLTGRVEINGRHRSLPCHCGILVDKGVMLHIEEATDSVVVPLDHPLIRHRVVGFYRHEELA